MGDIRVGSKVCSGCRMLKITIEVTGSSKDLGRDEGLKKPYIESPHFSGTSLLFVQPRSKAFHFNSEGGCMEREF